MGCAIRSRPMVSRTTCAPAWARRTPRVSVAKRNENRHCEERSDEAIQFLLEALDCFASRVMTNVKGIEYAFVEIRHRRVRCYRFHRPARGGISCCELSRRSRSEMGDGRAQPGQVGIGARC